MQFFEMNCALRGSCIIASDWSNDDTLEGVLCALIRPCLKDTDTFSHLAQIHSTIEDFGHCRSFSPYLTIENP